MELLGEVSCMCLSPHVYQLPSASSLGGKAGSHGLTET